eukprot:5473424-Pleurochrysis_carterae.AAC.2
MRVEARVSAFACAYTRVCPRAQGITNAKEQIDELYAKTGFPLAYVGDVVGTGSSRKSATNSILWCARTRASR